VEDTEDEEGMAQLSEEFVDENEDDGAEEIWSDEEE